MAKKVPEKSELGVAIWWKLKESGGSIWWKAQDFRFYSSHTLTVVSVISGLLLLIVLAGNADNALALLVALSRYLK